MSLYVHLIISVCLSVCLAISLSLSLSLSLCLSLYDILNSFSSLPWILTMISTSVYIFSMSYLPYSFFVYASKYLFKSSYKFPVHSSIHHYSNTFFPFHKNIHKLCISHSLSLAFSFLPYLSPYFISFLRPLSVALSLSLPISLSISVSLYAQPFFFPSVLKTSVTSFFQL